MKFDVVYIKKIQNAKYWASRFVLLNKETFL